MIARQFACSLTLLALARPVGTSAPILLLGSAIVFLAARRVSPVVLLVVAVVAGGAIGAVAGAP